MQATVFRATQVDLLLELCYQLNYWHQIMAARLRAAPSGPGRVILFSLGDRWTNPGSLRGRGDAFICFYSGLWCFVFEAADWLIMAGSGSAGAFGGGAAQPLAAVGGSRWPEIRRCVSGPGSAAVESNI